MRRAWGRAERLGSSGCRRGRAFGLTTFVAATLVAGTAVPATTRATAVAPAPGPVEVSDPAGWRAVFPAQPERSEGGVNGAIIHRVEVDDDIATVASYPETTFGRADATPAEHAEIYAQGFGGGRVSLANTPFTLAGSPAALFIFDLNANSGPARMFGLAVRRSGRMYFVNYFDRGRDNADAGRAFVESFAIVLAAAPQPAAEPADDATAGDATPSRPDGVAVGDAHWLVRFPVGAIPEWAVGIRHGLGTQWWRATVGGDTLRVDASELPDGYELTATSAAELAAQIASPGATGVTGETTTAGTFPAVRFAATAADGSPVGGVTVQLPGQLLTVSYTDVGNDNPTELAAFLAALVTQ